VASQAEPAATNLTSAKAPAAVPSAESTAMPGVVTPEPNCAENKQVEVTVPAADARQEYHMPEQTGEEPQETSVAAKQPRTRKPKAADDDKEKRPSALDAAAKVLLETGRAMTCRDMIVTMAAKGYWTSPGGKTPEATLYSAILRETQTKGAQARFRKAERGTFALAAQG
jgi:hypothetical protein